MAKRPGDPSSTGDLESLMSRIADEFSQRAASGQRPSIDDYASRFPELAEALREVLPALEILGNSANKPNHVTAGLGLDAGQLGDFRIIREVGRGGMGVVYEARQISLSRRVALKVLPFAGALDSLHLARFHNEALAAAQLHHSNIVPVYAIGNERGVHFYAMQFIDGETLARLIANAARNSRRDLHIPLTRRLREGSTIDPNSDGSFEILDENPPTRLAFKESAVDSKAATNRRKSDVSESNGTQPDLNPTSAPELRSTLFHGDEQMSQSSRAADRYQTVARLGIQAADALEFAHERGIIHRDIKPANLLLDGIGNLWITDFGLARIGASGNLTASGDILGTLRYMSPEQALGQQPNVDHRCDIYSLGATLYELLTFEPAIPGRDAKEILRHIANEDPRPPRQIDRSVPIDLETIVLKAMEKSPADRYRTARNLADELRRFLDHRPILSRRPSMRDRVMKWSRRHVPLVVSAGVTLLLTTVVLAFSALVVSHERKQGELKQQLADQQGKLAAEQTKVAEEQRRRADEREITVRQFQYVNRINLADDAWKRADFETARQRLTECIPKSTEFDLRGFEWYWLDRQIRNSSAAWNRHDGECYLMRFSPDHSLLATAGQDEARLWSWPDGALIGRLSGHQSEINCVAFSPDGQFLATASDDKTVRIWNAKTLAESKLIKHNAQVVSVVFSADGKKLFCAERLMGPVAQRRIEQNAIRAWDAETGREIASVAAHRDWIQSLAISPDGKWLASGSEDKTFAIWDTETLQRKMSVDQPEMVNCVAFAHKQPWLAIAGRNGLCRVWNALTGELVAKLYAHNGPVESISFCGDDEAIVTAGRDGTARVWEFGADRNEPFNSVVLRDGRSLWCAIFADQRTIITADREGLIKRWDRFRPPDRHRVLGHEGGLNTGFAFSPDGQTLVMSGSDLDLVDLRTGTKLRKLEAAHESNSICAMAMTPNSELLVTVNRFDGKITVRETGSWKVRSIHRTIHPTSFFAFAGPLANQVVIANEKNGITVFDAEAGQTVSSPLDSLAGPRPRVVFAPDCSRAVIPGTDYRQKMSVLQWRSGHIERSLKGHGLATFSRDGELLVTSGSSSFFIWKTGEWDEPLSVGRAMAMNDIHAIDLSPDKRTLAIAMGKGSIKLWHVETQRELMSLEAHSLYANDVGFTADGRTLVSAGTHNGNPSRHEVLIWRCDD